MAYKTPKHLRDRIKKHYNEKGPPENSEKKPTFAHPQADPTRFDRAGRSRKAKKATEANEAYIASLAGEREARTAAATRRRQEAGIGLQAGLEKKAEDIEAIKKRPLGLAARAGAKRMGDTARTTALERQLRAARQAQAGTTGTATERAAQAQREPADVAERMGAKQPATRDIRGGMLGGMRGGLGTKAVRGMENLSALQGEFKKRPRKSDRSSSRYASGIAKAASRAASEGLSEGAQNLTSRLVSEKAKGTRRIQSAAAREASRAASEGLSEGLSEGAQIGLRPQMEAPTPPKRKSQRRRQRSLVDPANRPPRKRNTRLSAAQRQNNRQY
jgi:hypothetical protein